MGIKLDRGEPVNIEGNFNVLAAAVHDIKTPLIFIKQASLRINQPDVTKDQRQVYLNKIESSAGRLLNLIESIIDVNEVKQSQLALEPVHLPDVVSSTLDDILPYAEEVGFKIKVRHSKALPLVLSHRLALRRVLFNLVDNALKYSQEKREVSIYTQRDYRQVRIGVRDYGVGVKKSDVDKIFKLFGKAKQPTNALAGSSGLGLFIASNLSDSMSAKLSVCPHKIGTTFLLRLPVASQLKLL